MGEYTYIHRREGDRSVVTISHSGVAVAHLRKKEESQIRSLCSEIDEVLRPVVLLSLRRGCRGVGLQVVVVGVVALVVGVDGFAVVVNGVAAVVGVSGHVLEVAEVVGEGFLEVAHDRVWMKSAHCCDLSDPYLCISFLFVSVFCRKGLKQRHPQHLALFDVC